MWELFYPRSDVPSAQQCGACCAQLPLPRTDTDEDAAVNASGLRLLRTLEPPVKSKQDAFWGGDADDAAEESGGADPKGALERLLDGKTGASRLALLCVSDVCA